MSKPVKFFSINRLIRFVFSNYEKFFQIFCGRYRAASASNSFVYDRQKKVLVFELHFDFRLQTEVTGKINKPIFSKKIEISIFPITSVCDRKSKCSLNTRTSFRRSYAKEIEALAALRQRPQKKKIEKNLIHGKNRT